MIISRTIILNLLLPVLVAIYLFLAMHFFAWVIDDLYIYFRYVDNFISGNGIAFNKGEYVEGFSSFLWFLYLSICGTLNFPLEAAAKYSSLVLSVINALIIYRLSSYIIPGKYSIVAAVITLFSLPYMLWAISGFELMLYIFLTLIASYIALTQYRKSLMIFLSLLLFLIVITRPEGILPSLAILAFLYFAKGMRSELKLPALLFSSLLILFLLFRYSYFGDFLPNTYYAKIGHDFIGNYELRSYKNGLLYFLFFLKSNPQFIPAVLFSVYVLLKVRYSKPMLLFVVLFYCQIVFIVISGGDWMVQYRFAVPAIPLLALITSGLMKYLADKFNKNSFAVSLSAVALCFVAAASLKLNDYSVIDREIILWNNLKAIAPSMNGVIPAGSLAASGACGIMPYYMREVNFIDMVGLTNSHIAKNGYRSGMWFERSLPGYVYSLEPQWLIMWKRSISGGEYLFNNAAPVYNEMSLDPGFADYELSKTYDVLHDVKIEFYKRKGN